jgi:biopolymer transport protein ExbD
MSRSVLRPKRREDPELNITSLVDVVFLLLVFFMLSTTFNRPTELQIELPEASAKASDQPLQLIHINIDRDGRYLVEQQKIGGTDVEPLEQTLQQAVKGRQDITVQINADAHTPHQAVITAMDAARRVGLLRIAFGAVQALD